MSTREWKELPNSQAAACENLMVRGELILPSGLPVGDITAIITAPGSGLAGGAAVGAVTLTADIVTDGVTITGIGTAADPLVAMPAGGDITEVVAGVNLDGGGAGPGSVTLDLAPSVALTGTLDVDGDTRLGDASAGRICTVNGRCHVYPHIADTNGFVVNNVELDKAADMQAFRAEPSGTFDATAAARAQYGAYLRTLSTRSLGANPLTNYGIFASAANAQENYSGYFDAGDFLVNGPSEFNDAMTVDGPAAGTALAVTSPAVGSGVGAITATKNPVGGTGNSSAYEAYAGGTLDATAAGRGNLGMYAEATATRSAGANDVSNVGIGLYAAGGQRNYAIETYGGDCALGTAADSIGLYGAAPTPQAAAIPNAAGGAVVDVEARAALNALLAAMRLLGPIAP